ncbi:leukocyte surface antigen CD53-like [Physella acuta]|uniref:leukocyte surface antigen CD53-like n=1 Tax=Physella acuta TaxID=109671 RepID=UPI0027DE0B5D|nr:leukocyte surface antigen CD53-like [Physella acuta]
MGQCVGCLKYILFIFNFCLWLLGCGLLSVGIWLKMDDRGDHYVQAVTEKVIDGYKISYSDVGDINVGDVMIYLLIVFGIILILVTFIGCCGAVRENMCLLVTFSICLFILMAALLSVGTWAFISKKNVNTQTDDLRAKTTEILNKAVMTYDNDPESMELMDLVQNSLRCCGVNGTRDYLKKVPQSCPSLASTRNRIQGCSWYYFYRVAEEIRKFLEKRFNILAIISFCVGFSLGLGIVISMLLCFFVRKSTRLVVS